MDQRRADAILKAVKSIYDKHKSTFRWRCPDESTMDLKLYLGKPLAKLESKDLVYAEMIGVEIFVLTFVNDIYTDEATDLKDPSALSFFRATKLLLDTVLGVLTKPISSRGGPQLGKARSMSQLLSSNSPVSSPEKDNVFNQRNSFESESPMQKTPSISIPQKSSYGLISRAQQEIDRREKENKASPYQSIPSPVGVKPYQHPSKIYNSSG